MAHNLANLRIAPPIDEISSDSPVTNWDDLSDEDEVKKEEDPWNVRVDKKKHIKMPVRATLEEKNRMPWIQEPERKKIADSTTKKSNRSHLRQKRR